MGSVYCWGRDANGALGNGGGANDDSTTPVEVTGITTATQVSVGDRHTCAVLADDPETADTNEEGTIQCWGRGEEGQLGNGETRTQVPSPVAVLSDPDDPNSLLPMSQRFLQDTATPALCLQMEQFSAGGTMEMVGLETAPQAGCLLPLLRFQI